MKVRILAFTLAVLLFGVGTTFTHYFLVPDPTFVKVPPEQKEYLSAVARLNEDYVGPPCLPLFVAYSDLVVKATVVGQLYVDYRDMPVDPDFWPGSTELCVILRVEYCIYGRTNSQFIEVRPDQSAYFPPAGETLILFATKRPDDSFYVPLYMEDGIFTIDEKNRLYSYSKTEELSAFDGLNPYYLYQAVWRERNLPSPYKNYRKNDSH